MGPELSTEPDKVDVNPNFQAKNEEVDSPSQQPATFEPIPYLSYLTEEPEDEEDEPVPKAHTRPVPLPVALFGSHVEKKHANNNQPFMTEFEVSQNKSLHFKVSCVCL